MSLKLSTLTSDGLPEMLKLLSLELSVIELFAYACYFANPEMSGAERALGRLGAEAEVIELRKVDYQRCLQAINRVHVLREAVDARLR